jgi:hypothetical protein
VAWGRWYDTTPSWVDGEPVVGRFRIALTWVLLAVAIALFGIGLPLTSFTHAVRHGRIGWGAVFWLLILVSTATSARKFLRVRHPVVLTPERLIGISALGDAPVRLRWLTSATSDSSRSRLRLVVSLPGDGGGVELRSATVSISAGRDELLADLRRLAPQAEIPASWPVTASTSGAGRYVRVRTS